MARCAPAAHHGALTTTTTTTYDDDDKKLRLLLAHTLVGGLAFVMRFKQYAIVKFEHPCGVFGYHARLTVQKSVRLSS